MLDKYLIDLGLNEKEAAVYLSLLSVDSSSVLDLATKTKIKRPTVYIVLESLAKKGLVSETTVGKKTHYQAEPPERLETYIERQKISLDEQYKRLKDVIPQIKSVQRQGGQKPLVQYFEGKEGVFSMNEALYENDDNGGTAYLMYSRDLLDEVFPVEERNKFKKVRLAKNVKTKVIYSKKDGVIPSDDSGDRAKIDEKKHPITCDISIYKDRVRIGILSKRVSGIFIKSHELAETWRSLFEVAFEKLKEKKD